METARNNRDANRGFFQNPSPPDGPRKTQVAPRTLPAADAHAGDNGTPVDGGIPCRDHRPDIAVPLAIATIDAPPGDRLDYSNAIEDEQGKTSARSP